MKKNIFFAGGGGGGGGGGITGRITSAPYLQVMSIILDFIEKKSEEDWAKQVVR